MIHRSLTITLMLQGPILTQSTVPDTLGIDAPFARTRTGQMYLPGTLVKGRLRQSLREIVSCGAPITEAEIDYWLGKPSANGVNPERSLLRFEDFLHVSQTEEMKISKVAYRIQVEPEQGTVKSGMIEMIEAPFASGEKASFRGTVEFTASASADAEKITTSIIQALRWTPFFGADVGVGFGRLLDVEHRHVDARVPEAECYVKETTRLQVLVKPAAPFCLAGRPMDGNTFEADRVISGAALKGSLATTLADWLGISSQQLDSKAPADWKKLTENLQHIRFCHSFPVKSGRRDRPSVPPLSLVKAKGKLYDVALLDGPRLINGAAPSFDIDWKERHDVDKRFGMGEPQGELRVRTAIDPNSRRALTTQLFAYQTVDPAECDWLGIVDFSEVNDADRATVIGQFLGLIEGGLWGLGKTKARLHIEILKEEGAKSQPLPPPALNEDGYYVITLQTRALLLDPDQVEPLSLFDSYQKAWALISAQSLLLERFFARQKLHGGKYLKNRFRPNAAQYEPYVLTEAGSVFVLKPADGQEKEAADVLQKWLRDGLPLPEWTHVRYGSSATAPPTWRECPFRPQEGFGEIVVDHPCHREPALLPNATEMEVVHGIR